MSMIYFIGGLALGFVLGFGFAFLYLQWRMKKQIGNIEEQMDAMMDLGSEMEGMVEEVEEEKEESED